MRRRTVEEIEAYRKSQEKRCSQCNGRLRYVCNIKEGSDTGWGREDLYQCEACKKAEVK